MLQTYKTEFLTAEIPERKPLLANDEHKQIVIDSMKWLTEQKRCIINAFVIMPNHIHLLWKIAEGYKRDEVLETLFSFTRFAFLLSLKQKPNDLNLYTLTKADKTLDFWDRNPKIKECTSRDYYLQTLEYSHSNPCHPKWELAKLPKRYPWSSAAFYELQDRRYSWLTHYND